MQRQQKQPWTLLDLCFLRLARKTGKDSSGNRLSSLCCSVISNSRTLAANAQRKPCRQPGKPAILTSQQRCAKQWCDVTLWGICDCSWPGSWGTLMNSKLLHCNSLHSSTWKTDFGTEIKTEAINFTFKVPLAIVGNHLYGFTHARKLLISSQTIKRVRGKRSRAGKVLNHFSF